MNSTTLNPAAPDARPASLGTEPVRIGGAVEARSPFLDEDRSLDATLVRMVEDIRAQTWQLYDP